MSEREEPATEAGREALRSIDMIGEAHNIDVGIKEWRKCILAIEREAPARLDVERLARALAQHGIAVRDGEGAWDLDLEWAEEVAAEYARLSEQPSTEPAQ